MKLKKTSKQMVEEANRRITTIPISKAINLRSEANVLFVDIRDVREVEREGTIPEAFHAPRGVLEFWVDPESPYFKKVFDESRQIIFFCSLGWRSALAAATVQDMGLQNVAHLEGGFSAWKDSGGMVRYKEQRTVG